MKRILLGLALACTAAPSFAVCHYSYSADDELTDLIQANNGLALPDGLCEKLNEANVALVIHSDSAVVKGVNVAWASISLQDKATGITGFFAATSTWVNKEEANQGTATKLMYTATNDALVGFKFDEALKSVRDAALKAQHAKK